MPGRLWFGCGSAADERPLWLEMLGERHTRIVYWPFALGPGMLAGADAWLRGNLDALGADYELTTWESLAGHRPEELRELADLLSHRPKPGRVRLEAKDRSGTSRACA